MKVYLFVGAWMFIGYMITKLSEKLQRRTNIMTLETAISIAFAKEIWLYDQISDLSDLSPKERKQHHKDMKEVHKILEAVKVNVQLL